MRYRNSHKIWADTLLHPPLISFQIPHQKTSVKNITKQELKNRNIYSKLTHKFIMK